MSKHKKKYNYLLNSKVKQALIESYLNLFCSIFEFENVPETCNMRYFQKQLYFTGRACFMKKNNTIYSLGFNEGGEKNLYEQDIKGIAVGFGQTFPNLHCLISGVSDYKKVECIPLYDTKSWYNPFIYVEYIIEKMVDLYRLNDILIQQAKRPCIISVEEKNVNNIIEMFEDIDSNKAFIIGSDPLGKIQDINILPIPNNFSLNKDVNDELLFLDNAIRKFFGLYNTDNNDKKERLIVDEINANNTQTELILNDRFTQREMFVENVNKIFGLNMKVKINEKVVNYESSNKTANNI